VGNAESLLKSTIATLAVIWLLNQFEPTRNIVQTALHGN
jgi:hypothetical protein